GGRPGGRRSGIDDGDDRRQMSSPDVHPTAIIDPGARIADGVEVGPYCVVGPAVRIAAGGVIGPPAVIERNVVLGHRCRLGAGAVLGSDPQDAKYAGEETWVDVGDGTRIREYATINRGTGKGGRTRIGQDCFIMSYAHVGHDCVLED